MTCHITTISSRVIIQLCRKPVICDFFAAINRGNEEAEEIKSYLSLRRNHTSDPIDIGSVDYVQDNLWFRAQGGSLIKIRTDKCIGQALQSS